MLFNYHTHVPLCGHAVGEPKEYVENAIQSGVKTLGFSDHAPYPFIRDARLQGFRMAGEQLEEYATTIRSLQKEYKNDIRILLGFELEYFPSFHKQELAFLGKVSPDFYLLGQHFVREESDMVYVYAHAYGDAVLEEYVTRVLAALETGDFLYLAHPDLANFHYSNECIEREYRRLCEGVKAKNIPLEMNMSGFKHGHAYPNKRFFQIAKDVGCDVVLGLDAHDPAMFLDKDLEIRSIRFLEELGITPIKKPLL